MPSRLGFGTSGIMGSALTSAGRLRLLEVAFEEGISHFDTAPLYGQGLAESLLGKFARSRRESLTITTKFGLVPNTYPALLRPLLPIARVVNRRIVSKDQLLAYWNRVIPRRQPDPPALSAVNLAGAKAGSPPSNWSGEETTMPPVPYTPQTISEQLEKSLRRLKTDYIDYYLLHECHVHYLQPVILECLERLVQEGKIRHYGIGSGRWQSRSILEKYATVPWVVQIPDTWANRDTDWFAQRVQPPLFTHSSLRLSLTADPRAMVVIKQRWAELTDQDPDQPDLLSELLLSGALIKNASGCVVFSSRHARHIRSNAALLKRLEVRRSAVETLLLEQQQPANCF
ncbi:MAG: aldo/keto reductase [Cyanobacteriota bacterium]